MIKILKKRKYKKIKENDDLILTMLNVQYV